MNRLHRANPPTLIDDGFYDEPPPPRAPRGCAWWLVPVLLIATFAGPATPSRVPMVAASPVPSVLGGVPPVTDETASAVVPKGDYLAVPMAGGTPPQPAVPQGAEPAGEIGTALIGGWATFYDVGPGYYAAAGPLLREALGDWRGQLVEVVHGDRSVIVEIVDACACGPRQGKPTFLDLSWEAFAALADPSVGVIAVSVELGGPVLPATDTPDQSGDDQPPHPDDERMRREVRDDTLYEGTP